MNRRKFIETSGAAAGAAVLGGVNPGLQDKPSVKGTKPSAASNIKIGLYSITYGGICYEGSALSFDELCKRAKEFGYDGVELDNKRPMGSPIDLDKRKRD